MPHFALSAVVTRDELDLPDLELNDRLRYKVSTQFLGGQVAWKRTQIEGPFTDGAVTTQRSREMVQEQVGVEVRAPGGTQATLKATVEELVEAFSQDAFTLTVDLDDATYRYACEAADYKLSWVNTRTAARAAYIEFTVPRQPNPLSGLI